MKTTKYLGFIIEVGKGIVMDPVNVEIIVNWEVFKTVKRVQRFLGFVKFSRKFIKNFSQLIMFLTNLVTKFDWSEATKKAFSKLKQIFVTAPLLIQFDNTRETVLETNVLIWCIGVFCFNILMEVSAPAFIIKEKSPGRMQLRNLR